MHAAIASHAAYLDTRSMQAGVRQPSAVSRQPAGHDEQAHIVTHIVYTMYVLYVVGPIRGENPVGNISILCIGNLECRGSVIDTDLISIRLPIPRFVYVNCAWRPLPVLL